MTTHRYGTTSAATTEDDEAVQVFEAPQRSVAERVLENIAAGAFTALLATAITWWLGAQYESYQWAVVLGMGWAGLLGLVRFSLDEAQMVYTSARNAQLKAALVRRRAAHDRTLAELRRVKTELATANNQLFVRAHGETRFIAKEVTADPVLKRAELLVRLKYQDGVRVSRRFMKEHPVYKWAEADYEAAIAILRNAGIYVGRDWAHFESAEEALSRLALPSAAPPALP